MSGLPAAAAAPQLSWRLAARVLRRATMNFAEDRCTHMAAAISYFALFALFPITLLAVSVFGIVLRDEETQARVLEAIVDALPVEETSIEDSLRNLAGRGPTLTAISFLAAAWTAGALSGAVRRSINVAFDVDRARPLLRGKLVDYSLLPVVGTLFIGSFALTAGWRVAQASTDARFATFGGGLDWLWDVGALAIPAALSFLTFLFLYWLLPNRRMQLRFIWPGAAVAAAATELTKFGFAIYFANYANYANYDVIYGSLAGVIVLLFWVYLSANILLFGAEVAAEVPHVLHEEPRHGHAGATESQRAWRDSLLTLLRGLVLAPGDQTGPAAPEHAPDGRAPDGEPPRPLGPRPPRPRPPRPGRGAQPHGTRTAPTPAPTPSLPPASPRGRPARRPRRRWRPAARPPRYPPRSRAQASPRRYSRRAQRPPRAPRRRRGSARGCGWRRSR